MIIITGAITGAITARDDTLDELRAISLAHVHRSRLEPGCLSHDVYVDAEDPLRLFFFETWLDRAAVDTHFAAPESGAFVRDATRLSVGPATIHIYDATVVQ